MDLLLMVILILHYSMSREHPNITYRKFQESLASISESIFFGGGVAVAGAVAPV